VHPGSHLQAQQAHRFDDRLGAAHGALRSREAGDEPVPGGAHLPAAEPFQLATHHGVVPLQEVTPGTVTQLGGALGRSHDVREQHRREKPATGLAKLSHASSLIPFAPTREG
jgi:hypothetical protein